VETAMSEASIKVVNTIAKSGDDDKISVSVAVLLTSPVVRTPKEG